MLKFILAKHQIAFLAALFVVNIVCSELGDLGILEEVDVDVDISAKAPRCLYACTLPYSPLCGSDGKTYGNICQLNTKNRCDRPNKHVSKRSDGSCPQQHCVRDPHPITCVCHFPTPQCFLSFPPFPQVKACANLSRPVCGSDRVTYRNPCQIALKTACIGYPVRVCHNGPCSKFFQADSIAHESDE